MNAPWLERAVISLGPVEQRSDFESDAHDTARDGLYLRVEFEIG